MIVTTGGRGDGPRVLADRQFGGQRLFGRVELRLGRDDLEAQVMGDNGGGIEVDRLR